MKHVMSLFVSFLLLLLCASCTAVSKDWNGFLAAVSVDTTTHSKAERTLAEKEVVKCIEDLGFKEDADLYRQVMSDVKFIRFNHPRYNTVFFNVYFENPDRIDIRIRDVRRRYPGSKVLKQEVEGLLDLLKKHFGEENVKFEQQSTFLA